MTEQKPHKWEKEIVAWAGGARIEQQYITCEDDEPWEMVQDGFTPNWDSLDWRFRLHDPYREFREAEERGEDVEFQDNTGRWVGGPERCAFDCDPRRYRIAPKPDPYQHLRDAIRAGKRIEFCSNPSIGTWTSIGTADDHNPGRTFSLPPDHYRIAKPDPKEEELYVLVSERDTYKVTPDSRPIVWEQFIDQGAASLENVIKHKQRIGSQYGDVRIAKLQFIDEED